MCWVARTVGEGRRMPLEATMVLLDNSEYMRNGDCTPTRMEAQHDAANLVCGSKTQQNPESTVGKSSEPWLTLAGVNTCWVVSLSY